MNNILVLTHIYPGEGTPDNFTPVVHYFTKEWVKLGYNVRVIHISNYFPRVFYCLPDFINKLVTRKYGCVLPDKRLDKEIAYSLDDVKVHRFPMFKVKPGGKYSNNNIDKLSNQIISYLQHESFKPDYIIAHWANPQAPLIKRLKETYTCKSALVLHDNGANIKKYDDWKDIYNSIDIWGYRSLNIKKKFQDIFGTNERMFRCFSGIPYYYLENTITRDCNKKYNRFVYVGQLIKRKYADVVIKALHKSFKNEYFSFDIVGDGDEITNYKHIAEELNITDKIIFHGRLQRDKVMEILDKSDIFCMISKFEVYGLVYLEAMARGCIIIASRGEGMQGIIEDGVNGFLCEAGNESELIQILSKIRKLSADEKQNIIQNAKITAAKFTDTQVAKAYIENVINL